MARLTVTTEAAMAKLSQVFPGDMFARKDSWQDKIENSNFMEHPAGR
jgi:hypothetical protein